MSRMIKNQHYIPRYYLKNFACDSNKKNIYNYDLECTRVFGQVSISDLFYEKYLHEIRDENGDIISPNYREKQIGKQEAFCAKKLRKILDKLYNSNDNCNVLTASEHIFLLNILSAQVFRLPDQIDEIEQMVSQKVSSKKYKKCIPSYFNRNAALQICVAPGIPKRKSITHRSKFALYPLMLSISLLFRPFAIGYTNEELLITGDHPFDIVKDVQFKNGMIGCTTSAIIYPLSPNIVFCVYSPSQCCKSKKNTLFHLSSDDVREINCRIAAQSRYICSSTNLPMEFLNTVKRSNGEFINMRENNRRT